MSVSYDDFKKLDIRVGSILEVEKIPGKTRIIKGVVDLGKETRNVIIGGAEFYEPLRNKEDCWSRIKCYALSC